MATVWPPKFYNTQVATVSLDPSKRKPVAKKVVTSKTENQKTDAPPPASSKPSQQVRYFANIICSIL